ncbi:uncharacterized protein [Haliotis cracherodii]|uniref:uncharacterized protein n=1 Tax=Haliotis cracherodii TaxID=6455 RepID=UPI0039ECF013
MMMSPRWSLLFLLMLMLLAVGETLRNGHAPRWLVNLFCKRSSGLTQVPWDCTGYLHCYTQGMTTYGVWLNCPSSLRFDATSQNCLRVSPSCMNMGKVAQKYCPIYSHLRFPHPDSCAMFYDCSRKTPDKRYGLKIYENECSYPTLFDPELAVCRENQRSNEVACINPPANKCDYKTECVSVSSQCVQDGYAPKPGTIYSPEHILCKGGKILSNLMCKFSEEVFDPIEKNCTSNYQKSISTYCRMNPSAKFGDPRNCARYYDCSTRYHHFGLKPYQSECQYMHLYDESSATCQLFDMIKTPCGNKFEPKSPCEYRIGRCLGREYCMACSASCVGQPDGEIPYPGIPRTRYHLFCRGERTVEIQECPKGYIFHPKVKDCVPDIEETTAIATTEATTAKSTTQPTTTTTPSTTTTTTTTSTTTTQPPTTTTPTSTTTSTSTTTALYPTPPPVCSCREEMTPLFQRLNNLTIITRALMQQMTPSVRSPFDCVAPPTPDGAVTRLTYEGQEAVARYTCVSEQYGVCDGNDVSRCRNNDVWTAPPGKCGRVVWKSVNAGSVVLDCPFTDHNSIYFVMTSQDDFGVRLKEDGTHLFLFLVGISKGQVKAGAMTFGLAPSPTSSTTTWRVSRRGGRYELFVNGIKTAHHDGQAALASGVQKLAVSGRGRLHEVRLLPPGALEPVLPPQPAPVTTVPTTPASTTHASTTPDPTTTEPTTTASNTPVRTTSASTTTEGTPVITETGQNLALQKPVMASAVMYERYSLETVVDGRTDNNVTSNHCFVTAAVDPWVMVDLTSMHHVTSIALTRSASDEKRQGDVEITVYSQDPELNPQAVGALCVSTVGRPPGARDKLQCATPAPGRFVRVQHVAGSRGVLTVCELEVFGSKVTGWSPFSCPNPPLLDKAMVDVHYSLATAVAVYSCDDGYSGGCDDNNLLYCTSDRGWEGRPKACIRVDSGTEETIGSVELPCRLKVGFAHEVWVEPKQSGSYIAFKAGNDTALQMTLEWPAVGSYIRYSYEVDGVSTTIPADTPMPFQGRTVSHITLLFLSEHLQILVDNETLLAVPHHLPAPLIDRIAVEDQKLSIKKIMLNQDWTKATQKESSRNLSLRKPTTASSNAERSGLVVDGSRRSLATGPGSCWQSDTSDWAPYWQVDIQNYYIVTAVVVTSRNGDGCPPGGCGGGLHDYALDVYMTNPVTDPNAKAGLCQFVNGEHSISYSQYKPCREEHVGRYVRLRGTLRSSPTDVLTVCEVEVMGYRYVLKPEKNIWSPKDCPFPPLLENMTVQISHSLDEAVATYVCDDGYAMCSDDNVVRCNSSSGWRGQPESCQPMVYGAMTRYDFKCPIKLGSSLHLWTTPDGMKSKPAVFLQTKQVPTVMSLSLDLNSPGLFHFKDGFKPQQPFKVNFPAIRTDVEYHFVYTFLSDYLQVEIDDVLVMKYPHKQPAHKHGALTTYGFNNRKVLIALNDAITKESVSTNLALNKPATSSSDKDGSQPGWLVDGNSSPVWADNTCWSHTAADVNVYWEVDLQGYYYVNSIVITTINCTDPCSMRSHDFEITVRSDGEEVCHMYHGAMSDGDTQKLACDKEVLGRYVRIKPKARQNVNDLLTFCEVGVYGSRLTLKQWSPFDCGAPTAPKNSLMTLTYTDTDAIATLTCNANSMSCGNVSKGVMRCSKGQVWTGASITCSPSQLEYDENDSVSEFVFSCPLTIFTSVEIWATPQSRDVKISVMTDNNNIAMEVVMDSTTAAVPFAYIRHHLGNQRLETPPFVPHQPAHIVFTFLPEHIVLEIDGKEVMKVDHVFDALKAERLQFTNLPLRKLKLSKGVLDGIKKEPVSRNVALQKPAKVSSTTESPARRVVDGLPSPTASSTTCWQVSAQDPNPWWQVDLQAYYYIDRLAITHKKTCAGCEKFLHDFEVEVLMHDPTLYPATPTKSCFSHPGMFPHGKRQVLDCLPDVFGRYVKIRSMKKLDASDSMTMCEVEVFVSKPTKQGVISDWSPFDCPRPPLPGGASVQVSHSATAATATYRCQEGFALCSGRTTINCNSSSGWPDADIVCKQAVFERVGMSMVELQCPMNIGDALEVWVTPQGPTSKLKFTDDLAENGIVLNYVSSTKQLEVYFFNPNVTAGNTVPASDVSSLKSGKEWHVVLTLLPEHLYITVNGRPVVIYPHTIEPTQILSISPVSANLRRVVWVRGHGVVKEPGPFDCMLPPPTMAGMKVEAVITTGSSLVARYTCEVGTAPCGAAPPSSTCREGIWQTVEGTCFVTTFRYPDITRKNAFTLTCPPVSSTEFHIYATPTLAQVMEIQLVNTATARHTPVLTASIIFSSVQYINTFILASNVTGNIIIDSFPFHMGQEFHMVITYLVKGFRVGVDGKDVRDVQVDVEGDFIPAVSMQGPMAVRTVEFQMPDNDLAYSDQPLKPDTDNKWITLPLSGSERTKLFRVNSCTEVIVDVKADKVWGLNVQFTLGARKNTKTDCTICETELTKWHSPLSCGEYMPFWLDWGNGSEMRVGAGYVIGRDFITSSGWPSTVPVGRIRVSANAKVKDGGNLALCTKPDPPPYQMTIDKHSAGDYTTTKYRCTDDTYMFCGEDMVSRCAATGPVTNQVKGECRQMTWIPKSQLNKFAWPCKRLVGSTVSLYLTLNTSISVSLMKEQLKHFMLKADSVTSQLTLGNTVPGGGGSVPVNPFPFPVKKRFHLTITILKPHFEVRVDGTSVATFPHVVNYTTISSVVVESPNVDIVHIFTPERGYKDCATATVPNAKVITSETSMGAEGHVKCNVEHRYCGSHTKVTCWSDGTWKFYRPDKCERYQWTSLAPLGKETNFPIPCALKTGDVIILQATLSRATNVFRMALVAGPEAVVLVTYDQVGNSLIISNVLNGTVLTTQEVSSHGLAPVAFKLSIKVLKDSYMIYVGGKMVSDFPSASPSLRVEHISVSSGTAVRSLEVTTTAA